MINHEITIRRRSRICLPTPEGTTELPVNIIASLLKNTEALGFTFSEALIAACRRLSLEQLTELHGKVFAILQKIKGIHREHKPMYPNFPDQVMEMSEGELYLNAIVHYLTDGRFLSASEVKERLPLLDTTELQIIDLGTQEEFERLCSQIMASNASLSEQDKADLTWFAEAYNSAIAPLLPEAIPQKETMAFVAGLLIQHTNNAAEFLARFCCTATDVLRFAVAMSGGDISLAKPTKFRGFSRAERVLLLGLLERISQPVEEMLRWKKRWIRLGERLHPGEYARKFPNTAEAFRLLRNDIPVTTFNSKVETVLAKKKVGAAVRLLAARVGDFARRLDHLLRSDVTQQDAVTAAFGAVADKVSTPVLLQIRVHFQGRMTPSPLRVFFPKGNLAKAYALPNELPPLPADVCLQIVAVCGQTLIARFGSLPSLGKVFVDPELA